MKPLLTPKSIAVLPFVNMSSDADNEYFSDGITEEIINALTKIRGLKVIARTSSFFYKNKSIDVREIGRQLDVNTVLEGSVRKMNERVRITAQLIDARDGTHLWSENFDRKWNDIFALQDEVSLLIADKIRENFGHLEITTTLLDTTTTVVEAYDAWLKGSYHLKRKGFDDIKKAIKFFQEATKIDPYYANAFASLSESYLHAAGFGIIANKEAHRLAKKFARKAIALDKKNAKGYKVLAYVHLFYDWDWEAAQTAYDLATRSGLPPQNEFITYYNIFLEEDFSSAIQVAKNAIEIDPLHVMTHWQLGLTYYFTRSYDKAIEAFSKALELDPDFGEALRLRGLMKGCLGEYSEGITDIERALEQTNGEGLAQLDLLAVKIVMGKKEEVIPVLKNTEYIDAADPAYLYALANMPDEAMYWLEKAYDQRSVMLVTLKNFWFWDNLREDSRFKALRQRMNYPPSIGNKGSLRSLNLSQSISLSTPLLDAEEIETYLEQLKIIANKEEIFINPALSLRLLAEELGLHPNKLSWLLNEGVGKNFNEYINTIRLNIFKKKALNADNQHLTLLGLAFESGFNSKTVFNSFFKKSEGVTPRVWLKQNKK